MARSANNAAYPSYLPRGWRVAAIAGVTTAGLGFGLVQPAPAEWLKQSAKPPARSSTRPIPAENGFTGTIRRLMSDSRRAAELGDYAKAVQLAERAAKISEATAQLLGPTSECSPQETSRFLAEMRAAQSGSVPAVAAQPRPAVPAPQIPPRASANPPVMAGTKPTAKAAPATTATPTATPRQSQPAVASVAKPQNQPAAQGERQIFGAASRPSAAPAPGNVTIAGGTRNPAAKQASQAGHTQVKAAQSPVPPAPAKETSKSDQLLAQSRLAAAEGDFDSAIELAKQAAGDSSAPSFFGAGGSRPQNTEANRWLERLIAQRDAQLQPAIGQQHEVHEEVFEPPIKVASKLPRKAQETAPVVARVGNETVAERTEQTPEVEPALASRSSEATPVESKSQNSAEATLWSEELPEATRPAVTVAHEPVKFSRRTIDASAGWVDADALESATKTAETRPTVAESLLATDQMPDTSTPMMPDDATPEFSIGDVPLQSEAPDMSEAAARPDLAKPAAEADPVEPAAEVQASPEAEVELDQALPEPAQPVSERGSLRLRQHISQMPEMDWNASAVEMAEAEEAASESPLPVAERGPLRFRKNPIQTADLEIMQPSEPVPQSEVTESVPPSRGTLRLRPQIQQVAGVAKEHPPTSQHPTEPAPANSEQPTKSPPHTFADIPSESIEVVADETAVDAPVQRFPVQRVLRLRQRIKEATALNPGGQPDATHRDADTEAHNSTEQTPDHNQPLEREENHQSASRESDQPAHRPAVKLRERTRLKLDDPTSNSASTPVPRTSAKNRQPVVARSESNLWKSVDSDKSGTSLPDLEHTRSDSPMTAAAQPLLPPPITQARFESTDPKSTDLQKTALSVNESAAGTKSDFDFAPPPPVTNESHPWHEDGTHENGAWKSDLAVRKTSFALIDQLADAFNVPAKTLVSLITGAGAVFLVGGLLAMRAAMRRRHSA